MGSWIPFNIGVFFIPNKGLFSRFSLLIFSWVFWNLGNQKATVCCLCDISILFRFDCFFIYVALSLLLKIFLFFFFFLLFMRFLGGQTTVVVCFLRDISVLFRFDCFFIRIVLGFFFSRFSFFFSWVFSANKQLLLYVFSAISLFYLDLIVVFACLQEKNMLGIADYPASWNDETASFHGLFLIVIVFLLFIILQTSDITGPRGCSSTFLFLIFLSSFDFVFLFVVWEIILDC